MQFEQKKSGNHHKFTFERERVTFAYSDRKGSGEREVDYAVVPAKHSVVIESEDGVRLLGYVWVAIGTAQLAYSLYLGEAPNAFWMVVGLACLVWHQVRKVAYSVFETEQGNLFIIQDGQHERIMSTLLSRRRARLKALYGEIDPDNDIELEIEKFQWLKTHDVLTEAEADMKIAQVERSMVEQEALN